LIPLLPAKSIVVERAQELRLPPDIEHRAAIPPGPQTMPVTFAEAIDSAVDPKSIVAGTGRNSLRRGESYVARAHRRFRAAQFVGIPWRD